MKSTLSVLYQDDCLIAVNKPAGMMVHRSVINPKDSQVAMTILRNQLGKWVYPVHRLDRPTAGVLLFALDKETARHLTKSFETRQVKKTYLAIIRGIIDKPGTVDKPLKGILDRIADKDKDSDKSAQSAKTIYNPIASIEIEESVSRYPTSRYTLVELQPETGRRHQLRRHLHHISHPIIGDTTYGDGRHNRFFRQRFGCKGLLLSAVELTVNHPESLKPVIIIAPVSEELQMAVSEFSWQSSIPEKWLKR